MGTGCLVIFQHVGPNHPHCDSIGLIIKINYHEPLFKKLRMSGNYSYNIFVDGILIKNCPPRWFTIVNSYSAPICTLSLTYKCPDIPT